MGMEKYVVKFTKPVGDIDIDSPELTTKERIIYAYEQVKETVKKVFWYVIVGVGTILSFMMGVTALSLPSIIMLKKVVQNKLLINFVGIVAVGIIIIGYAFNAFSYLFI